MVHALVPQTNLGVIETVNDTVEPARRHNKGFQQMKRGEGGDGEVEEEGEGERRGKGEVVGKDMKMEVTVEGRTIMRKPNRIVRKDREEKKKTDICR